MSLPHTRAIIDAIHSGELLEAPTAEDPIFGVAGPDRRSTGVPRRSAHPEEHVGRQGRVRRDGQEARVSLFKQNFAEYEDKASDAIRGAGPRL